MIPFNTLIRICWFIFMAVWFISSFSAKRNKQNSTDRQRPMIRLVLLMLVFSVLKLSGLRQKANSYLFFHDDFTRGAGVLVCAAGIALAIWARIHIGKNWGMPMSLKDQPDLVTSGPYRYVRHPIYTGLCVAMIGSMLTEGLTWLFWLLILGSYFIYSAKKEERLMLEQFPDQYPAYMKRTKMLIPFLF